MVGLDAVETPPPKIDAQRFSVGHFLCGIPQTRGVRAETCGLRQPTIRPVLDHFLLSLRSTFKPLI